MQKCISSPGAHQGGGNGCDQWLVPPMDIKITEHYCDLRFSVFQIASFLETASVKKLFTWSNKVF